MRKTDKDRGAYAKQVTPLIRKQRAPIIKIILFR